MALVEDECFMAIDENNHYQWADIKYVFSYLPIPVFILSNFSTFISLHFT